MTRPITLLTIALLLAGAPVRTAAAAPTVLPDSSTFETYTLANGLRVVCRHLPISTLTAITMAYDFGSDSDPVGREGLTQALAEIQFDAAAGEVPERNRADMPSLRPAGWNLLTNPRLTRATEVATQAQLPGVLHQMAQRARGVTVTEAGFRKAIADVKADLRNDYRDQVGRALYFQSGARSRGADDAAIARYAGGQGLQKLTLKEAQALIAQRFVPANAVLSLAGNLGSLPLRTVLEREFGTIPTGTALAKPPARPLRSVSLRETSSKLTAPAGVIAVGAPALTDSLHPAFYMAIILTGGHASERWGRAESPLTSRFHYSLMDEPDVARFYPPLGRDASDPALVTEEFISTSREIVQTELDPEVLKNAWRGLDWLLGGPLPPELRGRVSLDAGGLSTLSSGAATRELWGGEAFWSVYRRRFRQATSLEFRPWLAYYGNPDHIARILMTPAGR